MDDNRSTHFLGRPQVIRRLWQVFAVVLALTVLAQLEFAVKGYFTVDGWFGFGAVYGFTACLLMVLVAKLLGKLLKRPQDYYAEREGEGDNDA